MDAKIDLHGAQILRVSFSMDDIRKIATQPSVHVSSFCSLPTLLTDKLGFNSTPKFLLPTSPQYSLWKQQMDRKIPSTKEEAIRIFKDASVQWAQFHSNRKRSIIRRRSRFSFQKNDKSFDNFNGSHNKSVSFSDIIRIRNIVSQKVEVKHGGVNSLPPILVEEVINETEKSDTKNAAPISFEEKPGVWERDVIIGLPVETLALTPDTTGLPNEPLYIYHDQKSSMQESIDLLISNPPLKSPPPPTSSSSSLTWGRTFKAAISKLIRPLTPASTPKTALKKNCKNLGVTSFKKKFKMTFFVCCCKIE